MLRTVPRTASASVIGPESEVPVLTALEQLPEPAAAVSTVQVDGDTVKGVSGKIYRVEGGEALTVFPLFDSVQLPPGKYRVSTAASGRAFKPTEVEIKPYTVGTVKAVVGTYLYTVSLRSDGSVDVSKTPFSGSQSKLLVSADGVDVRSALFKLFDGSTADGNEVLNPANPPVYASIEVEYSIPVYSNGRKVDSRTVSRTVELLYDEEPSLELRGGKLLVKTAIYSYFSPKLRVTFAAPGGTSASVELDEFSSEVDLLQLYRDKVKVPGLLWSISGELLAGGKTVASVSGVYDEVPDPSSAGVVFGDDYVDGGPFPVKIRARGCLAKLCKTNSYTVRGRVDLKSIHVVDEVFEDRVEVHVDVVAPKGVVASKDYTIARYSSAKAELLDVDGSRIDLSDPVSFAYYAGRVGICAHPYAVVDAGSGATYVVSGIDTDKQSVTIDGIDIEVLRSCAWIMTPSGEITLYLPDGRQLSAALRPLQVEMSGKMDCGSQRLSVSASPVSSGRIVVEITGEDLNGKQFSVLRELPVTGKKVKYSSSVEIGFPLYSASVKARYYVRDSSGNLYKVLDGDLPVSCKCRYYKCGDGSVAADPDALFSAIDVGTSVTDRVMKYYVKVPDDFPAPVTVNGKTLRPGQIGYFDSNVLDVRIGRFSKTYTLPEAKPVVSASKDEVVVSVFPPSGAVTLTVIPVGCEGAQPFKVTLTPDRPALSRREIARVMLRSGCVPGKAVVMYGGLSVEWQFELTVEGSFRDRTARPCVAGLCGEFIIKCGDKLYKYPDDLDKVRDLCPLYAVIAGAEVPVGRPELSVSVAGRAASVSADSLYFGLFSVSVRAMRVGGPSIATVEVGSFAADKKTVKEFSLPDGAFSVEAVAAAPNGARFSAASTVYGVEDVYFEDRTSGGDLKVDVYFLVTSSTPVPVGLYAVAEDGSMYTLLEEEVTGVYAKVATFSVKAFEELFKKRPVKLKAVAGSSVYYHDLVGTGAGQGVSSEELLASPPVAGGLLSLLLRLLGR